MESLEEFCWVGFVNIVEFFDCVIVSYKVGVFGIFDLFDVYWVVWDVCV